MENLLIKVSETKVINKIASFKIQNFIKKFAGNNPSSKTKYFKMNEKIEQILKRIFSLIFKLHIMNYVVFNFLRTIIDYFIYDLGDNSYHLFYLAMWPYNWKTPIGYLVTLAIEFSADACSQIWFTPTMAFYIGLCWFSITFARDIAIDLNFLYIGGTSKQRQSKLIKRFCGIVQLYGDARQLRDSEIALVLSAL